MNSPLNALIVVDTQVDFCPGGSLAVENGDEVARRIHRYIWDHGNNYHAVIATKCWHPADWRKLPDFAHFSDTPDFEDTWPAHCIAGTEGANFHPNLGAFETESFGSDPDQRRRETAIGQLIMFDKVFYKGQRTAAYSGFEGVDIDMDPRTLTEVTDNGRDPSPFLLESFLRRAGVGHIDTCGIAIEKCVDATAVDAMALGYSVAVLSDLSAGLTPESSVRTLIRWKTDGIRVVTSEEAAA